MSPGTCVCCGSWKAPHAYSSPRVPLITPGSRDKLNTCTPQNPTPWPLATARFSSERKLRYGNQCSSSKVGSTLRWLSSFGAQNRDGVCPCAFTCRQTLACDSERSGYLASPAQRWPFTAVALALYDAAVDLTARGRCLPTSYSLLRPPALPLGDARSLS